MFVERLADPPQGETYRKLQRARQALMGVDEAGFPCSPGMFDAGVVSFAHGEGVRRPWHGAVRAALGAIADANGSPIENYMFLRPFPDLETAIRDEFIRNGVPEISAGEVVLDAGSTRLIVAALALATREGAEVVTAPGFYHPLAGWCAYLRRTLHVVPGERSGDYKLSAEALARFLAGHRAELPPVLLLFNPTMTGAVYSRPELEAIADVLLAHGMIAVEDALFAGSEHDQAADRARLAATRAGSRCLTVAGASKLHCLANLRIGWGCGPAWMIAALKDFITSSSASLPHVGKAAALGALQAPARFIRRNVAECRDRIALVEDLVGSLDARLRRATGSSSPVVEIGHPVAAGHSLLIEFPGLEGHAGPDGAQLVDGADLTSFFLREAGVAFAPALSHGFDGLRLRANVASLGTQHTYAASRVFEIDPPAGWGDAEERAFDEGFARGRDEIAAAFAERIEPALLRLLAPARPARIARPALPRRERLPGDGAAHAGAVS
jgi:aspartate aminotransferase